MQNRFQRELASNPHLKLKDLLRKLLPTKIIPTFISKLKMPPTKMLKLFTDADTENLISLLKDFSLEVSSLGDFSEAIVTAGGVKLDEVNPLTLESKKTKNLYLAGELLNLDANTGGYNLQIAFSTAYLARISAAKN